MLIIAKLPGKSPFAPLQTHMDKVSSCIEELPALFKALIEQDLKTPLLRNQLIKRLYQIGDGFSYPAFHLSLTLFEKIGHLASLSEQLVTGSGCY